MALRARQVDPRDVTWEVDSPTFRVHLWRRSRLAEVPGTDRPADLRQSDVGWVGSEWELTGGQVDEVLAWADEHVVGWDVAEVWVVVPESEARHGLGMIRLRGHNPGASSSAAGWGGAPPGEVG